MPRLLPVSLLTAGLLAVLAGRVQAQAFSVSAFGGLDAFQMDREDYLATFTRTYNTYYTQRIKAPVEAFAQNRQRPVVGLSATVSLDRLQARFFGQVALDAPQRRTGDLTGVKQHLSVDLNDQMVGGDVAVRLFGPVAVGATFAGMFRRSTVVVESEYADGSRSQGTEYSIHGRYIGDDAFLEFGPMASLELGRLSVPVRLFFPFELSKDRSPLLDFDVYRSRTYFPSDWPRYLNDANGLDEDNAVSVRDFVGPRVQVGLDFRLF